MLQLKGN